MQMCAGLSATPSSTRGIRAGIWGRAQSPCDTGKLSGCMRPFLPQRLEQLAPMLPPLRVAALCTYVPGTFNESSEAQAALGLIIRDHALKGSRQWQR